MSNFSKYIDSLIVWKPVDVDGHFWAQCVDFARAVSLHLGFPITSYGNAWDIYKKWSEWYHIENVGSYKPLPGDLIFMWPAKANGKAGHIAVADEGSSVAVYKVVHQNYGVQGASGSWIGDRHAKRQTIPAQQWGWILARNTPFQIK